MFFSRKYKNDRKNYGCREYSPVDDIPVFSHNIKNDYSGDIRLQRSQKSSIMIMHIHSFP